MYIPVLILSFLVCTYVQYFFDVVRNQVLTRINPFMTEAVYGCSFVAKLSSKKNIFLKKYVFCKIYIICRKNVFMWKKKFYIKNLLKKTFFTKKNINENVKIYIYLI